MFWAWPPLPATARTAGVIGSTAGPSATKVLPLGSTTWMHCPLAVAHVLTMGSGVWLVRYCRASEFKVASAEPTREL